MSDQTKFALPGKFTPFGETSALRAVLSISVLSRNHLPACCVFDNICFRQCEYAGTYELYFSSLCTATYEVQHKRAENIYCENLQQLSKELTSTHCYVTARQCFSRKAIALRQGKILSISDLPLLFCAKERDELKKLTYNKELSVTKSSASNNSP